MNELYTKTFIVEMELARCEIMAASGLRPGEKPTETLKGSIGCRVCGARLEYSINVRGGVVAHCATDGCLSWME